MCKGFGSSLSGPALQWFTSLPNSSISTFAQLNDLFVEQFVSSRKIEKHTDDLYTVIQRPEKTLQSFVGRFNREKVLILGCNIDTAVSAFRKGLKRGSDLYKELTKYPCKMMEDALAKAWAQIKWEEDEANSSKFKSRNDPPRKEHRSHIRNERYRADPYPRNPRFDTRDRKAPEQQDRRLPEYNLYITPSEAVNAMKGLGQNVKWPPKMRTPDNERDRNKFCDFHNDHEHRIDDCIALRLEVIKLLKRGHLTDLLTSKGKENWNRRDDHMETQPIEPPRIDRTLNCITEGSEISGISQSSAKRHCRSLKYTRNIPKEAEPSDLTTLSFSNSEVSELSHPHHDALVISLLIANCLIKQTLIDSGSSSNVIFLSTLKGMQVKETNIIKKSTTLIGFSGEHKTTLGEITLPTYIEGLNLLTKFQVIDAPSVYSVIMGRLWIHELRAVPSTYHQIMKFPTPWGVRSVRGEQIHPELSDHRVSIGSRLTSNIREQLIVFLKEHHDCFARSFEDMTVLVREDEGRQDPVYYASRSLLDAETRYPQLEMLALALIMASRKMKPYFQSHSIKVVTEFPLRAVLRKPDLAGRLSKWAIELGEYDIGFVPQTSIKSQFLSDFIADFSHKAKPEEEMLMNIEGNDSNTSKGSGMGLVLINPAGIIAERSIRCGFKTTNNEAKYEALIAGLNLAADVGAKIIRVMSDSQLIINQFEGEFQAKDSRMVSYLAVAKQAAAKFEKIEAQHITREENRHADALANLGSAIQTNQNKNIQVLYAKWPAVWKGDNPEALPVDIEVNWMTPLCRFLTENELPEEPIEAR
ncbi:hypothetical protein C2S53_019141 [Perilla frutescens var. hirtella]|uniref:RNase H type-1 domain-containing protein n=1 Tax=Perilla frutescens var. hirtella TaxID=608512 RepID=A0AAD4JKU5_PERFH|nr:hypothetical protein C2S53_019141 [Perilla frutescens var. hirtella]